MRRPRLLPIVLTLSCATAIVGGTSPLPTAIAQETPAEARALDADLERLRNSPFFARDPQRVRDLVTSLLKRGSTRADGVLRGLLLDARTEPNVVEQIASVTVLAEPHRLLDDVVDRLRAADPAGLEARLDAGFTRSDAAVVRRLVELCRDPSRTVAYRRTAVRLLSRTGDVSGLAVFADLWAGPDRDLREEARAAFDAVVPGGAVTVEEARVLVERIRRDDVPLADLLRRMLREKTQPVGLPTGPVAADDYRAIAMEMLQKATLEQLIRLYVLGSPLPDVRAAATKRLATFPYDEGADADGRVRAARALFQELRREDTSAVENEILTTLAVLAPSVRGNVSTAEMDALLARVRPGAASRETRLRATRLVGELRDERAAPSLESAYLSFGDSDTDARLAILDALQELPVDRTEWLVARTAAERRPDVLRKLVLLLGRSREAASTEAFATLLRDRDRATPDVRRAAAEALATQWAASQSAAARAALVAAGLKDPDADVRTVAAGALGIAGGAPDSSVLAALLEIVKDTDGGVRHAAARSVIVLDESRATANLMGRFTDDSVVFEAYRDHFVDVVRRDQAPDRMLAACDALAAAGLRPFAVQLLEATTDDVLPQSRGRSRLSMSLVALLLDEGRPGDAEPRARALVRGLTDDATRDRATVLLARALTAGARPSGLAEAEQLLVAIRASGRLDRASDIDAAATLGDARLRRGDPLLALEVLEIDAEGVPAPVRLRLEALRDDARVRVEAERKVLLSLVDGLGGSLAAECRAALLAKPGRAARFLSRELALRPDFATTRRLLDAVAVVTGGTAPRLADDASAERLADVVATARKSLAGVPFDSVPFEPPVK
ncbi:MAG: HEAT repeat domain-containing protein [Planctomycetes bacterium]|nr:HEAT repeat domain-containing protein [Planctomycetota bacterium]